MFDRNTNNKISSMNSERKEKVIIRVNIFLKPKAKFMYFLSLKMEHASV